MNEFLSRAKAHEKHKLLPDTAKAGGARPRARNSIILQPRHLAAAAAQVRALKLELGPELRHLGHRRQPGGAGCRQL